MGRKKEMHHRGPGLKGKEREAARAKIAALKETTELTDAAIAEAVGMSRQGVEHAWKRYQATHSVEDMPRTGRRRKVSSADDLFLFETMQRGGFDTVPEALVLLGKPVCKNTVRNSLLRSGAKAYVKQKKPALTALHMAKRLKFVKDHMHWDGWHWRLVVFTDEAQFVLHYNKGRQHVWDVKGRAFNKRRVQPQMQNKPSEKVMLWAAMYPGGILAWKVYEAPFKSEDYITLIKEKLPQVIDAYDYDHSYKENLILQQDNAPQHASKKSQAFLQEFCDKLDIDLIKWPPKSPDLSPIENFWALLKKRLRAEGHFKTKDDLQDAVTRHIQALNAEADRKREVGEHSMFVKMYKSLPGRMRMVRQNKGGSTTH